MTDELTQLNRATLQGRSPEGLRQLAPSREAFQLRPLESEDRGGDHDKLLPLTEIDFIGRTPFASQGQKLDPLSSSDLGGMRPPPVMMPLNDLDFMPGTTQAEAQQDEVQRQAQRWVSQTFVATILKQSRNSPFKSDLFSGGRGGEAFSPLMDQHLADRVAPAIAGRLARQIAGSIAAKRAYGDRHRAAPQGQRLDTDEKDVTRESNSHQNVRFNATPALGT